MLKRKVSCTFKRKITLEIQERIYPLENCRRDGGATVANRHYILQTLVRTAGRKGLRYNPRPGGPKEFSPRREPWDSIGVKIFPSPGRGERNRP
jgi:hypothetical protein